MRVYYFIDQFDGPVSGTEKQLFTVIRELVARGHDAKLFVLRPTGYTKSVRDFPCPIENLGIESLSSPAMLPRLAVLRRRLRREAPSVVHGFFNDCAMLVPLIAPRRDCRTFTSRRDMGYWYTTPRRLLLRVINCFCTAVICNSEAVASNVMRRESLAGNKAVVIHNGIEPASVGEGDGQFPAGFDADISGVRVCLVANLRPIKRIEDLILAASVIKRSGRPYRFWVIGESLDDSYESELRRLSSDLDVADSVRLTGQYDEPRRMMRNCDIGLLTSSSEGLSNTLLEYLAEGLPVVCTDTGGNPELVSDGVVGYLYPVGDVDALVRHLVALGDDAALRHRLGHAARRRAGQFSVDACVAKHIELYTH